MASRRGDLPTDIGAFGPWIGSFELSLQIAERSPKTIEIYTDAARWLAQWLTKTTKVRSWGDVSRDELRLFFLYMQEIEYARGYRNNIGRALQAFFKWYAAEEEVPDPFDKFKAPPPEKLGAKRKPIIETEQMAVLIKDAERGKGFEDRRDAALLRLFAATGCRLAEITGLELDDVNVAKRTALVTGKGGKQRVVKFDVKAALALDRYLRKRAEHKASRFTNALWIGVRRSVPMTPSGVRQIVRRRGARLGMKIHPHLFRHTFTHNCLDAGMEEGDLMELNGWESRQMLLLYGSVAKGARAQRAYDRIDVMRGV
ncbi:tyrosine-type recombinase/integrase [Micromonospora lupini]|uniref:tyrosine-type recombinase/integrase n=1 Tax=Micromonospora lupini TaxID=285679 RepID=UPI00225BECA7|nr:tyrosine-type recombinase/integrase [Micromonospora lupini]MCX5066752.1 tyrosine-type recombinase/integrase [Micromonospora lupini]